MRSPTLRMNRYVCGVLSRVSTCRSTFLSLQSATWKRRSAGSVLPSTTPCGTGKNSMQPTSVADLLERAAYEEPTRAGKTTAHTDTYHGRFVSLVPNEQVVEEDRVRDRRSRAARHDDDYSPAHRC